MEIVIAIAVFAAGVFVGTRLGAARALALMRRSRSLRRVNASVTRFMPDVAPTRSTADILSGRLRLTVCGREYVIRVLSRDDEERWLATLDGRFVGLASAFDDAETSGDALAVLAAYPDDLYDVLLAYDKDGVLPSATEWRAKGTSAEAIYAVLEVWRAANPLLDHAVARLASRTKQTDSARSSTSPPSTDGTSGPSAPDSRPSSSSPSTSTPPTNGDSATTSESGSSASSPPAWATGSPATGRPTRSGATPSPEVADERVAVSPV